MARNNLLHNRVTGSREPEPLYSSAATTGVFPLLLGSTLLGTIGIFVNQTNTDSLTATWFRCAFGLLSLTLWMLLRGNAGSLRLTRATRPWVLAAGSLMVLAWGLFFFAIERISTGVAVVLFHVQPLWVLVLGALYLKESFGRQRITSVIAAMLGLVLATGILKHSSLFGTSETLRSGYWLGVVACLIGAFCTASVTIITRRLRNISGEILAWWQCAIGTLVLCAWPMHHGWPEWGISWGWLAGLGLIHTGLAYTLMYAGMACLATGRIATLQFVYPAVAILIDWLYFNQRLSAMQLVGILLISAAIWFAEYGPREI